MSIKFCQVGLKQLAKSVDKSSVPQVFILITELSMEVH